MFAKILKKFSEAYPKAYQLPEGELTVKKQHAIAQEWYLKSKCVGFETKVFHVLNHDDISADTGANAFLPPKNIENIATHFDYTDFDGYHFYQPSEDLANHVEATYKHLGYLPDTYHIDYSCDLSSTASSTQSPYAMTYGHGTTQIFDAILKNIIKEKRDVIIVPTPTYGLFIPIMKEHARIKTLPSTDESIGSVDPDALLERITAIEEQNLSYYKSLCEVKLQLSSLLPEEAIKIIRGIMTTSKNVTKSISARQQLIDSSIDEFNHIIDNLKTEKIISKAQHSFLTLEPLPRVRVFFAVNPAMPTGKVLNQLKIDSIADILSDFPSIQIIEDVTHRGIQLDPSKVMGTFAKSPVADRTLVLDGISKIFGLARARAAFVIGHRSWINPIAHTLHMTNCTFNGASLAFLEGVYNLKPDEFKIHLKDISEAYKTRLLVVRAIIDGLNETIKPKNQAAFQRAFFKRIKDECHVTVPESHRTSLFSGIPGLRLYNMPEAGYFVLLDMSAFVGQYLGAVQLNTGIDFRNAFFCLSDVNTISDSMCYDSPGQGKAYIRFSLSMDKEIDIVEGLLRIKKVLACLKPALEVTQAVVSAVSSNYSSDSALQIINSPTLTLLKDSKKIRSTEKRRRAEEDEILESHIKEDAKKQCLPDNKISDDEIKTTTRRSKRIAQNPKLTTSLVSRIK